MASLIWPVPVVTMMSAYSSSLPVLAKSKLSTSIGLLLAVTDSVGVWSFKQMKNEYLIYSRAANLSGFVM